MNNQLVQIKSIQGFIESGSSPQPVSTYRPFSDRDVTSFIRELTTDDAPGEILEAYGVGIDKHSDIVPMLVEMSVQWLKDSSVVSAAAGARFWQAMHAAALNKFQFDAKDD